MAFNLQSYFNTSKDLKQATTSYFSNQLGFNFENLKTSDQPIEITISNKIYNLNVVFQLTGEELHLQTDILDSISFQELKYSKYLVCCYNFGNIDKIPNKSLLANFNRQLSRLFEAQSGMPNLIIFRYTVKDKTYITFSISELREKPNQRTGRYIASKIILFKDIDIEDTHRAHIEILKKLNGVYKNFDELHQQWLKTLNIKELSDQFYKQVKIKYDVLVEHLVLPSQSNTSIESKKDFVLRLVGRLIFCWFLKAKGWIPSNLLSLEAINQNSNYYHKILETLFFECLNKDPKTRDLDKKEMFESVPYLNGGLFEAKSDDHYDTSKAEFLDRSNFQLKIEDGLIQDIFKLFEDYYFTVDENTSTEQEIGVDPEMMGRIFENFILNRSSTGSFYTPREIVDYMVEGSLFECLKEKIKYSNLSKDSFLDLSKQDDYILTGIAEHYPKRRFVVELKQNKIELSVYLLLKVRGWTFVNDKVDRLKHRHQEIGYNFWSNFLTENYTITSYFFAKPKDVDSGNGLIKIPKIGMVINIDNVEFILILSFSTKGFWMLDTCYQIYGNKLQKLQKDAKKNLNELSQFWRQKNIPQGEIETFGMDGYYHQTHSKRQLSEIFSVFQSIYKNIIKQNPSVVKKFSSDTILDFVENVFNNTKKQDYEKKKIEIVNTLQNLKILDPACGSGAFSIGVLQKLSEIKHSLEPDKTLYEIKLNILQNSIYGVDILPIATEISRLRCWLSLVVDEDKNNPKPLPNLEFKFVTANSLVGIEHLDFGLGQDEIEAKQNELKDLRKQTFEPAQNKSELKEKWDKLSSELFDLQVNSGFYGKNATDLSSWNPFENKSSDFFDPEWMFGVEGFDLVIGNPPYVGEKGNKDTFEPLKQSELGKRFYQGKMDLFYFFFHFGLDILKNGGVLSFITTNYYITATGGTKLRNDFKQRSNVLKLINFGELKIFESALGQHNLITLLQKKEIPLVEEWTPKTDGVNPQAHTIITQNKGYLGNEILENIIAGKDPNTNYYQISQANLFDENGYIKLTNGGIDEVLDKMLIGSDRLDQICHINTGFNSGADWVTNSNLEQIPNSTIYSKGQGIFALTKDEFQNIFPETNLTFRFYKNSDIEKYSPLKWQNIYIIYTNKNTDIENYPNIHKHLLKFRPFLEIKREFQTGQLPWFSMHWPREKEVFTDKDKIVLPYRSNTNTFTYSNGDCFASKDILYIRKIDKTLSIKFLLGVLNSKLIYKWLYYRGKRKGEMLELYQKPLSEIPIPTLDTPEKREIAFEIEYFVEQILELKNEDSNADISDQESKINTLVFDLYELDQNDRDLILSSD